jgi:uncharacterized membrane protein YraQ (UPF0718 family)
MALRTRTRDPRAPVPIERADHTWRWVLLALIGVGVAARVLDPMQIPWLRSLLIVFGSLLVEAMPFVAIGAAVSAAIEVFVPASSFAKIGSLPRAAQLPAAAIAGIAFPVCECGSVPVARRLARKGLSPAAAVTFMLAAPVVNPVVIASTYVAYRGRDTQWLMVGGRFLMGLIVAMCVGWVVGAVAPEDLLRGATTQAEDEEEPGESRVHRFFSHLSGDLLFMARFLILGALIAATIQTFVPATAADRLASLPILSLLAMMFLAFILSLCSESDAFVAASFTAFGPAAQLAFLVFGPMVDTKLTALYIGTYNRNFFRTVLIVVTVATLVGCLWIEVIWG